MSDGRLPAPVLGDPDASVTLAVYEDYACGHCVDYNLNGFPDIRADFIEPGDIRYEHRDAPIPVANPGSFQAASAAREVQARYGNDAFWDYAKKLFENSNSLRDNTELLFERLANELDFADAQAIADAGVNRAHEQTVQADRQMAQDVGVPGTPGFVINGTLVTSGFNQESLSTVRTELNDALSNRA
jgi:protein-disulfide isomerase